MSMNNVATEKKDRGRQSRRLVRLCVLFATVVLGTSSLDLRQFSARMEQEELLIATVIQANETSFLIPPVPDPWPTIMLKRAFVSLNDTLLLNNSNLNLSSCPVTSQVRIITDKHKDGNWILESLTMDGELKSEGGDEYYITYIDRSMNKPLRTSSQSPTAIAFVNDRKDGSYELRFVTSPSLDPTVQLSGNGYISIVLQYSCGVGRLAPPAKLYWNTGGAINAKYIFKYENAPPMETFAPPRNIDLGRYDQVIAFGDSMIRDLAQSGSNMYWPGKLRRPLNMQTVQRSFLARIRRHVKEACTQFEKVALVLGSGVWDILAGDVLQGPTFDDHRAACRLLLTNLRQEFPHVDLYWKSLAAMHIHRVAEDKNDWYHVNRVFYMSTSRAYDLYQYQKKIMEELNVTMLDLYTGTYLSADRSKTGDGRHFTEGFNKMMVGWFYSNQSAPYV